jgi:hypothetical protein
MPTWVWIALGAALLGSLVLALSSRVRHGAGTVALLARDRRVPRPIRWLLVVALLPIPGPAEEIAGGIAIAYIARRLPDVWAEHHHRGTESRRAV